MRNKIIHRIIYDQEGRIYSASSEKSLPMGGYEFKNKEYIKVLGDPRCISDQIKEKNRLALIEKDKDKERDKIKQTENICREWSSALRDQSDTVNALDLLKKPPVHIQYFDCKIQYSLLYIQKQINCNGEEMVSGATHRFVGGIKCGMTFGIPEFLKWSHGEYFCVVINKYMNHIKFYLKGNTGEVPNYILRECLRKEDVVT